jgi:hypothetical protein
MNSGNAEKDPVDLAVERVEIVARYIPFSMGTVSAYTIASVAEAIIAGSDVTNVLSMSVAVAAGLGVHYVTQKKDLNTNQASVIDREHRGSQADIIPYRDYTYIHTGEEIIAGKAQLLPGESYRYVVFPEIKADGVDPKVKREFTRKLHQSIVTDEIVRSLAEPGIRNIVIETANRIDGMPSQQIEPGALFDAKHAVINPKEGPVKTYLLTVRQLTNLPHLIEKNTDTIEGFEEAILMIPSKNVRHWYHIYQAAPVEADRTNAKFMLLTHLRKFIDGKLDLRYGGSERILTARRGEAHDPEYQTKSVIAAMARNPINGINSIVTHDEMKGDVQVLGTIRQRLGITPQDTLITLIAKLRAAPMAHGMYQTKLAYLVYEFLQSETSQEDSLKEVKRLTHTQKQLLIDDCNAVGMQVTKADSPHARVDVVKTIYKAPFRKSHFDRMALTCMAVFAIHFGVIGAQQVGSYVASEYSNWQESKNSNGELRIPYESNVGFRTENPENIKEWDIVNQGTMTTDGYFMLRGSDRFELIGKIMNDGGIGSTRAVWTSKEFRNYSMPSNTEDQALGIIKEMGFEILKNNGTRLMPSHIVETLPETVNGYPNRQEVSRTINLYAWFTLSLPIPVKDFSSLAALEVVDETGAPVQYSVIRDKKTGAIMLYVDSVESARMLRINTVQVPGMVVGGDPDFGIENMLDEKFMSPKVIELIHEADEIVARDKTTYAAAFTSILQKGIYSIDPANKDILQKPIIRLEDMLNAFVELEGRDCNISATILILLAAHRGEILEYRTGYRSTGKNLAPDAKSELNSLTLHAWAVDPFGTIFDATPTTIGTDSRTQEYIRNLRAFQTKTLVTGGPLQDIRNSLLSMLTITSAAGTYTVLRRRQPKSNLEKIEKLRQALVSTITREDLLKVESYLSYLSYTPVGQLYSGYSPDNKDVPKDYTVDEHLEDIGRVTNLAKIREYAKKPGKYEKELYKNFKGSKQEYLAFRQKLRTIAAYLSVKPV